MTIINNIELLKELKYKIISQGYYNLLYHIEDDARKYSVTTEIYKDILTNAYNELHTNIE